MSLQPAAPESDNTASHGLWIFRFDDLQPSIEAPVVDAGPDQTVDQGPLVVLDTSRLDDLAFRLQ